VFKRIAQIILPDLFAMDGTTAANRLKGQLERYAPVLYFTFSVLTMYFKTKGSRKRTEACRSTSTNW
jgi:hypothetical protein